MFLSCCYGVRVFIREIMPLYCALRFVLPQVKPDISELILPRYDSIRFKSHVDRIQSRENLLMTKQKNQN